MPSRDEIIEFCQKYSAECHKEAGEVGISFVSIQKIGFNPVAATYDQLRGACVGLTYTLLFKGMNEFVMPDHRLLWDSVGKRLLGPPSIYFAEKEGTKFPEDLMPFRDLFLTAIKTSTREWVLCQARPISEWKWPPQESGLALFAVSPAYYLVYPLLEGTLKFLLSDHLKLNGLVLKEFNTGDGTKYKEGKRCSRVEHMLDLVMQMSSHKDLAEDLQLIFKHIEFLYPGRTAPEVISQEWRNPAMHGQSNVPTAAGTVLNMVLLVAMEKVKGELTGSGT